MNKIVKRLLIILITVLVGVLFGFLANIIVIEFKDKGTIIIVRYEDTGSVQEARLKGIKDIEKGNISIFPGDDQEYRLAILLKNPNNSWAVKKAKYIFIRKDNGDPISKGELDIGAAQSRLAVQDAFLEGEDVGDIEFVFENIDWREIENYKDVKIRVRNTSFQTSKGEDFSFVEIAGSVVNESDFYLEYADISVLAKDENGEVVAAGSFRVSSLKKNGQKDFLIKSPYSFGRYINSLEFLFSVYTK